MRNKFKTAFTKHKYSASQRNIPFKFTYEQWVAWWRFELGPNWFELRGCTHLSYVMARKGDKGPYAVWNVKCITHAANNTEKIINKTSTYGERHKLSKLKEHEALFIKQAKGVKKKSELAKMFNVSLNTIHDIQKGRRWSHLPS